jgi:hypothetical protein
MYSQPFQPAGKRLSGNLLVEWTYSKPAVFLRPGRLRTCLEVGSDHLGVEPKLHRDTRLAIGTARRHEHNS